MATNDTNRVTKDTSARKGPSIRSKATTKANEKMPQLILDTVEADYEEEIAALKTSHAAEVASFNTRLENAVNETMKGARAEHEAEMTQLNKRVSNWEHKYSELEKQLQAEIMMKNKIIAKGQASMARVSETAKAEIADLNSKVALELYFCCKGGVTRAYLRRPNTLFQDAVVELRKAVGVPTFGNCSFYTSNVPMDKVARDAFDSTPGIRKIVPGGKTLLELGIKDKDVIWFIK